MVEQLPADTGTRLLLTPNRSLSWHGNVRVWLALVALSMIVVSGMSLAGAWLVLPFAGLELAALAAALYVTARHCQQKEVLTLSADTIRLEKGIDRKDSEWEWPRQTARIDIHTPRHPWTTPKLSLRHHTRDVSLAPFLNHEDVTILIGILEEQGVQLQKRAPPTMAWF
ncbi:hypothetical protein CF392_09260 [Tamilnaduibacter salinus]|uniref:DUF2244 domain-containing protein n=1 Tax=Tamilnaduibacter salinus TaxID=1484056 RepID=A0A2A2I2G3_9GAMM|nr:DUF2244 domain-containing protein [Tamilnaduibacter salinus]PAV25827.1 hypothetical protein CF392_09260 [Tamilnaduibacter salinus]